MTIARNPIHVEALIKLQKTNPALNENLTSFVYGQVLNRGDYFIDVGVQVGHHLFPMARRVSSKGRGLGIEANPDMYKYLDRNIDGNSKFSKTIKLVKLGAGKTPGHTKFYARQGFPGWSSTHETHVHPNELESANIIDIEIDTIDNIVSRADWKRCDFIKLDIEHGEFPALQGAQNTVDKFRPIIVFENSPRGAAALNNYKAVDFFDFFDACHYKVCDIYLNDFVRTRWVSSQPLPSNYIAYPEESGFLNDAFVAKYDKHLRKRIKKLFGKQNIPST